jgi:hypothetical protein
MILTNHAIGSQIPERGEGESSIRLEPPQGTVDPIALRDCFSSPPFQGSNQN